jgi:hypothetical protein
MTEKVEVKPVVVAPSISDNELNECTLILIEQVLPEISDMRLSKFCVNIMNNNRYLSYNGNNISFSPVKKNSNWVLEKTEGDSMFYIRASTPLQYGEKYLGCPNRNNRLYLYTTNNRFTQWKIVKNDSFHSIKYAGDKFNPADISLVIARHNEDVQWVTPYNDIACIYNKGRDNIKGVVDRIVPLENIGREGHTYLYHIIDNYDKLTEKTIFLQGDPFTHNNTILYGIDNYDRMDALQPMGLVYIRERNIPPPDVLEKNTKRTPYGLHYSVLKITDNCEYHTDNAFKDKGLEDLVVNYKRTYRFNDRIKYRLPEISIVSNFLNRCKLEKKRLTVYPMTFCALFSVSKDIIQRNSIEAYFNISSELTDKHMQGGENGYVLERLWLHIFDYVL